MHGPIAHLRIQFKSINTFEKSYDYIITLIRRGKIPLFPFLEPNSPIFKILGLLPLGMLYAKFG